MILQKNKANITLLVVLYTFLSSTSFAAEKTLSQESHGNYSPNIRANVINYNGLTKLQYDEIMKRIKEIKDAQQGLNEHYDEVNRTRSESLREIDELSSKLYRSELKNLPSDSKKYAEKVATDLDLAFKEFDALERKIQETNKNNLELSKVINLKIRNLFDKTLQDLDEKITAIQKEGSLKISYKRPIVIDLFSDNINNEKSELAGEISFLNGYKIYVNIIPGVYTNGMYKKGPELLFTQVINDKKIQILKFYPSGKSGYLTFMGPLSLNEAESKLNYDFPYYPNQEILVQEDFHNKFIEAITRIISFVYYQDSKL